MIPIQHSQPYFDSGDEDEINSVLSSKFVTSGGRARQFGEKIAQLVGKRWGIAVNSGTDAITTALHLLRVMKGDEVGVPAYMCSAPLDSIKAVGAIPIPLDIERTSMSIDSQTVSSRTDLKALIVPHLFGAPAKIDKIEHPSVIEDCAQTVTANIDGRPVGSFGKFTVCSFYGTKLLTTGHGGMILGDDQGDYERIRDLYQHDKQETWTPHYHFLMSDLNAALGLSQVAKLQFFIRERSKIATRYRESMGEEPCLTNCIYSRFLVIASDADNIINYFQQRDIEAKRPVYKPISKLLERPDQEFPNTTWAHNHVVSVPIYPGMNDSQIDYVSSILAELKDDLQCWPK